MAAPSYTEDLTDIATGDEDPGVTAWTNFSTNDQGTPKGEDSDYPYIQGLYAVTQTCSKSKTIGNLGFDYGSTISLPTDGAFLVWQNFSSPFAIDDYAGTSTGNAGLMVLIGDDESNFEGWDVGGKDKTPMPYGGWQCHAVNTTVTADDTATGTKTIDRVVGAQVSLTAYPSKGEVHQVDVLRFGRCSAIFEDGDVGNGYATIPGFAAINDNQSNRWGLLQETAGGYLWQGRISLGSSGTAVDFRDSNRTIFIKWTPKVTANFNLIEILHTDSNIEMTGFTFQLLDITTASKGRLLMTDDADVAIDNCTFIDMDSFIFSVSDNAVTIDGTIFRRCGLVTQGAAVFDSCVFDEPSGAVGFLVDDLDDVDDCIFNSDGTGHAIELDSSMAGNSYTMSGCSFVGYGSTGTTDAAIYNNTGGTVTIGVGTGQIPTHYNVGAGSVTTITASVLLYIIVKDTNGDPISGVQVGIYKTSDRSEIISPTDTDGAGEVDTSYTESTPVEVEVRCRKASSADTPKYINYSSIQTIATTIGLSLSVTLQEDPNNNATT